MPETSPAKWHLAHSTWFFEQFLLSRFVKGYTPHHPQFGYLFNSYYNEVGPRHQRPQRGILTRPTMNDVAAYRIAIDAQMMDLLAGADTEAIETMRPLIEIGLHHELQHQELLLTDVKHLFWCNPLRPAYLASDDHTRAGEAAGGAGGAPGSASMTGAAKWITFEEGVRWIGHDGNGFAYDNEGPHHRVFLDAFELASRTVTNREYLEFIRSGGYAQPKWWLDEGWTTVQHEQWRAPLYWEERDGAWWHFTLGGMMPLALDEPVCHVSYFEADAYARWAGARLARESEWEVACQGEAIDGNFAERALFHPAGSAAASHTLARPASRMTSDEAAQRNGEGMHLIAMFGNVWEWTASPYAAYPGYVAADGALGEYNGKFMCNQWVLRGGSCATAASHIRPTYRNFFHAAARWQFSGIRLARGVQ